MASKAASGMSGLAEIRELSNCTWWRRERGKREGRTVEGRTDERERERERERDGRGTYYHLQT